MKTSNKITYANRGMWLENIINDTNLFYLNKDICIVYKKPTPIKILNVKFRTKETTLIDKAVFSATSTLDYNGVYKGKYIEFDAKECHGSTSFPLINIKPHQIKHIENVIRHKGIAFIIIFMNNDFYLLKGENLIDFIKNENRKSIPFKYIKENGFKIKEGLMPRLNYIESLNLAYKEELCEV